MKYHVIIAETPEAANILLKKKGFKSEDPHALICRREDIKQVVEAVKSGQVEINDIQLYLGPNWQTTGILNDELYNRLGAYPEHVTIEPEDIVKFSDPPLSDNDIELRKEQELVRWFEERMKN